MPAASATTIVALLCGCAAVLRLPRTDGFHFRPRRPHLPLLPALRPTAWSSAAATPPTALHAFQWPDLSSWFPPQSSAPASLGDRNGLSPEYPWRFEGRFVFRPSLVRTSPDTQPPAATLLSLFGYSLGGSVVLEYDVSPVGPYREYVTMGGIVGMGRVDVGDAADNGSGARTLGVGQWGTDLYVSTQAAEDVCRRAWGVPAEVADIRFVTGDRGCLADGPGEDGARQDGSARRTFALAGWDEHARILGSRDEGAQRYGNIPIYWTPTIKALWAPLLGPGGIGGASSQITRQERLPLHKLRLSAGAVRIKRCKRVPSPASAGGGELPLGVALVVDNVLIEIGERIVCE